MRARVGAVCLLLGGLSACGYKDGDDNDRPQGHQDGPAPLTPTITLLSPAEGDGSYGNVTLTWSVQDFTLVAPGSGSAAEDQGHVHVYLDGALMTETGDTTATLQGLTAGEHTVLVRLAQGDEQEIADADAKARIDVIRPKVTLAPPVAAPIGSFTTLPLTVTDFTLDGAPAGTPAFGSGYYVVRVDGADWDWGVVADTVDVGHLAAGTHTISVELVGNDGAPLDPPVTSDEVTVAVPEGSPYVSFDHAAFADVWDSSGVPLALTVSGFTLKTPHEDDPPPDTGAVDTGTPTGPVEWGTSGWYHMYIDGVWYTSSAELAQAVNHLAGGWHTIDVVLVDGKLAWEMPVRDTLRVHVAEDRPDIKIASPGNEYGVHGTFDLTVQTENFTLAADHAGGADAADEGQYEIWVDGVMTTTTGAPTTSVTGLEDGHHTVKVVLTSNSGSELAPMVYDQIGVNVDSSLP